MPSKLRVRGAPATVASLAVILVLALADVIALSGGRALASHVSCGDTITTDTTLDSDLINCPNNGVVIGADGITLDLNGHLIEGDGTPVAACPRREFCDVGVLNDGHDGVTLMRGSVREFATGVLVGNTSVGKVRHNRVLGVSSSGNRLAALGFFSTTRSLVRNSSGSGSTSREDGDGMFLVGSHHVRVLHSSFQDNGQLGIHVDDSSHNLIKGNLLSRNRRQFGIILESANRNQVRRNRIRGAGVIGIYVAPGSRNVIARNRVSHVLRPPGVGILVEGGDRNVIARNSVHDTRDDGIRVGFDVVVGNVVRRNHIHRAGDDGVHIDDKASQTLLTRNVARRNRDLGIEVEREVIDGGGNIASGNGDPRQCMNITCN